jgi:hypothetical protein
MQLNFFNTVELSGQPLLTAKQKAGKQDERIEIIMKDLKKATPFMVWEAYNKLYPEIPITSVRRSMTVLTRKKKVLEKLGKEEMKTERLGMKNHYWRVK